MSKKLPLLIFLGTAAGVIGIYIVSNLGDWLSKDAGNRQNTILTIAAPVNSWSKPIRVTREKCIFAWGEDPDGSAFLIR